MYQTIYQNDFVQAFEDRRPGQFSRDALAVLFDFMEEIEESTGEKIELDVVGLCCEYVELELDEINEAYSQGFESLEDAADWLGDETIIAGVTCSTVVFAQF